MSEPLLNYLKGLAPRLADVDRLPLLLDYDGTLTAIVNRPEDAHLSETTRGLIESLRDEGQCAVAIISGRALGDVKERVGVEGIAYAGNHGMEIEGPGMSFIEPKAAECRKRLSAWCAALAREVKAIPGARVEDKGLTASVHYRLTPAHERKRVREVTEKALGLLGNAFRMTLGNMVYEVRPRVDWHKGKAVRWILDQLGMPNRSSVYIGDDTTDEDAFKALPEGVTIRIGGGVETAAEFFLPDQSGTDLFLAWLSGLRGTKD